MVGSVVVVHTDRADLVVPADRVDFLGVGFELDTVRLVAVGCYWDIDQIDRSNRLAADID